MRTYSILSLAGLMVAVSAISASCVNEAYDLSKPIDTEVTVFQDDIVVPIGQTEKIYVKDFLKEDTSEYIKLQADGTYAATYSGNIDLTESIPDFSSQLKVPDFTTKLMAGSNLELSSLGADLLSSIKGYDQATDPILDPASVPASVLSLSGTTEIDLSSYFSNATVAKQEHTFPVNITLPSSVSGFKGMELESGAQMTVSVKLRNNFLTAGTITPDVTLDLSDFMAIDGKYSAINLSQIVLNAANGFSASKSYSVTGLNPGTFTGNTISATKKATTEGTVILSGLKSTPNAIKAVSGKTDVLIQVAFTGLKVKSVSFDKISVPVDVEQQTTLIAANQFPKEVVSVSKVEFEKNTNINLDILFSNLPDVGSNYRMVGDLNLPSFIHPASTNGMNVAIANNRLSLPLALEYLDLTGINLQQAIGGKVSFHGSIEADNPVVKLADVKNVSADVMVSATNMKIKKVTGKVDFSTNPVVASFKLNDMSNLIGEGTTLDIGNPHIAMTVTDNIPVAIDASCVITPYKDGQKSSETNINVTLPSTSDPSKPASKTFWLGSSNADMPQGSEFVKVDVSSIIKNVPDSVIIRFVAASDKTKDATIDASAKYTATVDYTFGAPLAVGKDFRFVYRDTLAIDESTAKLLDQVNLTLGGEIENGLPLALDAEFSFADADMKVIPLSAPASQHIASCKADGTVSVSPLEISIEHTSSLTAARNIIFSVTLAAGDASGLALSEKSYISAILNAKMKGGLTVDLKDSGSESEN